MNIDYNDERFQNVEKEKNARLKEVSKTYDNMIKQSDKYYDQLSDAAENYGKQQQELQQQRTDFTIDQINQNKEWAKQDYTKEQKGAYQDYRKESNQYGVNAEQMAQAGLLDTGYAESSRVSMYNTYQNRVATARESYNRAVVDYDNQIKDAQLQNNSVLAELAYKTLKTKLEYSLQGFQYKNSLIQQQLSAENDVDDRYYNRWKDVLSQLNTDRAFAYQQQRDAVADSQWQQQYNLSLAKLGGSGGTGGSGGSGYSISNGSNNSTGINKNDGESNEEWKKTNLIQTFSDGSKAEVYKNPTTGQLLFWDSINNEWVEYGGNMSATGGKNAYGTGKGGGSR